MPTSVTKELEKASLGEGSNGVVGKSTTKKSKLVVGLWKTSQNYEVEFCHKRKKWIGLISTRRRETYSTGRINEELGSFISTINSNSP